MPVPSALPERARPTPMSLLEHGVPLTLLLDLAFGPRSEELLQAERGSVPPQRAG